MAAGKSADAYRTISEAAVETGLKAHVLRFWESKFAQLKPVKQKGGRRHYRPQDIALIQGLRVLLHDQGLTIKGAQKYLREHGVAAVAAIGQGAAAGDVAPAETAPSPRPQRARRPVTKHGAPASLDSVLERLEAAKARLDTALRAS